MRIKDEYYKIISALILLAAAVFLILIILLSDFREIIFLIPDDSSYYLKIARNFSDGKGFTFDGINQTNGFQPLWQYILIGIDFFLNESPEHTLKFILVLQVLILVIAGLIYYKILSKYFNQKIILACCVCFIIFVFFQAVNGMETALLVLMISLLFYFAETRKIFLKKNSVNEFTLGMIFGLVILTRLDSIFFTIPVGILFMIRFFSARKRKESILLMANIAGGIMLVILPYLIYNLINFHNIIPISGYLKSSFPAIEFTDKFTEMLQYREIFFVFFTFCYLAWFAISFKKINLSPVKYFAGSLAIMSGGILILFIYIIFFMNWVVFSWYFITYSLFVSLAVSIPAGYILSMRNQRAGKIIFGAILFFVSFYWGNKIYKYYTITYTDTGNNWNIESYNAAQWAKENTYSEDIFAMKDAGHFSYYSGRNVISLDGLVNNFEYQEIIRNKQLNGYFEKNNVKYLVQHAIWGRENVTDGNYDTLNINFVSHKYSSESDPVIVKKKDEVFRSAPYYDGKYRVAFLIWKINY